MSKPIYNPEAWKLWNNSSQESYGYSVSQHVRSCLSRLVEYAALHDNIKPTKNPSDVFFNTDHSGRKIINENIISFFINSRKNMTNSKLDELYIGVALSLIIKCQENINKLEAKCLSINDKKEVKEIFSNYYEGDKYLISDTNHPEVFFIRQAMPALQTFLIIPNLTQRYIAQELPFSFYKIDPAYKDKMASILFLKNHDIFKTDIQESLAKIDDNLYEVFVIANSIMGLNHTEAIDHVAEWYISCSRNHELPKHPITSQSKIEVELGL